MERRARYVLYQMRHFEHCTSSFLDRLSPMWKNKALHHSKRTLVYLLRQNWGNNRAPNSILHPENVVVDRSKLLYPNDYLRVPLRVLN